MSILEVMVLFRYKDSRSPAETVCKEVILFRSTAESIFYTIIKVPLNV